MRLAVSVALGCSLLFRLFLLEGCGSSPDPKEVKELPLSRYVALDLLRYLDQGSLLSLFQSKLSAFLRSGQLL